MSGFGGYHRNSPSPVSRVVAVSFPGRTLARCLPLACGLPCSCLRPFWRCAFLSPSLPEKAKIEEMSLVTELVQIQRLGEMKRAENEKFRQHLKRHVYVERKLKKIADEIENQIDCRGCAQCCKQSTVKLFERELEDLAKAAGMRFKDFLRDCVEPSEEEGIILKRNENGCIFLHGNDCLIYEGRPSACRHFPHLTSGPGSIHHRMWLMEDRATYCAIVYNTLEEWKKETGFTR